MGKFKNGLIKGPIGNLSYREMDGEQIVQSKPGKGQNRMSTITMAYAGGFSIASALASNIRESFQKSINGFHDGKMVNRLNGVINTIIGQFRDITNKELNFNEHSFIKLSGFEFNIGSPLRDQIGFQITTNFLAGQLSVSISRIQLPSQLKFPAGFNRCEITFSLSLLRPLEGYRTQYPERKSTIILKEQLETEETTFTFSVPEGCLYILTLGLRYTALRGNLERLFNNKKFNPAAIVEAYLTPGTYSVQDELQWIDMPTLKIN